MKNNFSQNFNQELEGLNKMLGKLSGPTMSFTLEDLEALQNNLMKLSLELDTMLTGVMQTAKKIKNENRIYDD